jgi:hypothetical protein
MISIRRNVFETNSSSTHSICICTEDTSNKWKNGELVWYVWNNELISVDEANKHRDEYDEDEFDSVFQSYDYQDGYLEFYDEYFTTPSGDKMVAFGLYGRDG